MHEFAFCIILTEDKIYLKRVLFNKSSFERFHPSCMGMAIDEAKKLEHFLCSDCSSDDDAKRSLNSFPVSTAEEGKVRDASPF